jgi:TctA family transporter
VNIRFLSKVDQTSSCIFMNALAAIATARQGVADAYNKKQRESIVGTAAIITVSYIVFLVLLMLFIRF